MKLRLVTKLEKRNKTMSEEIDDDIMLGKSNFIIIFPIYGQFGAISKTDSGRIVCKTYFSLIKTFDLTKPENRTKNL